MAEEAQHHLYSASGAEGWLNCAGKIAMEAGYPDSSSPAADQGSAAHYLGAYCLLNDVSPHDFKGKTIHCWSMPGERDGQTFDIEPLPVGAKIRSSWPVTQEMAGHIQGYVDFVRKAAEGKDLYVEQRVHFGPAIDLPGAFGTLDAGVIARNGSKRHKIDLKYGYGEVSAEENSQMMLYDAGLEVDFDLLYDFDNLEELVQTIYQPRIDNISSWSYTRDVQEAFLEKARAAIKRSEEARALIHVPNLQFETLEEWAKEYLNPTEKGCKWCKRKADCPALAEAVMTSFVEANADDFEDLDSAQVLALPVADFNAQLDQAIAKVPTLPFDTVVKLFGAVRKFEDWLSAIESRVLTGLLNGETHPDYKLVQGKQGNRKWASEEEAEKTMKSMRLKLDEMYDRTVISPTSAEKLLKERPRLWTKLQPLITRSEGKITVAPITDKRPAYIPENPLDALPDLTEVPEAPAEAPVLESIEGCDFI
jgi:hypothetical protein